MRRTTARTAIGIASVSGVIVAMVAFGAPSAVAKGADDAVTASSSVVSDDAPGHDATDDSVTGIDDSAAGSDDAASHDVNDDHPLGGSRASALDIDGDGLLNPSDRDIDGDSLVNRHDRDMDGDGTRNGADDSPRGAH